MIRTIFGDLIGPEKPITGLLRFWPVLIGAFVASLAATWLCKEIALKFGIVDKPDKTVKTHGVPVAYLGGIGMLMGLAVGVFAGLACLKSAEFYSPVIKYLLAILAGGTVACFVGFVDDIFDIDPKSKFLGQIIAALILVSAGIRPELNYIFRFLRLDVPEGVEILIEAMVVVFLVLGATNSLNLLDGLDGLCGGVTAIIILAMLLLSIHLATWEFSRHGDIVRIILCLGLVGGVIGFLPFNRHPAKIFMGDAGSMLLGFMVAALMVLFAEKVIRWWMASIVVFGLPILDTAVALVRRFLNHRPLFVSDRGHIYDQMIDRGIPLKRTVAICYVLAGAYALVGLLMSQIRARYAAIVYVLVLVISALTVWKKGYLKMQGLRGAAPPQKLPSV